MNLKFNLIVFLLMLTSSLAYSQEPMYEFDTTEVYGAEGDEHGCTVAAGYTYSQLKKECIRIFEQKILVKSVDLSESYRTRTCIIFSADRAKAEIYLRGLYLGVDDGSVHSIILKRKRKNGVCTWENKDIVVGKGIGYFIKKGKVLLYKQ